MALHSFFLYPQFRTPNCTGRRPLRESGRRGARGRAPTAQPEIFRPHVGAGLVPARREGLKDTDPPGECVRPGGVPRGERPSWAFELGWVSGGEENAIFPSRGSFLFGSFSLDKQRERISVSSRIRRRDQETKAVPRGRPQGSPLRHDLKGEAKRKTPLSPLRGTSPRGGSKGRRERRPLR